ncbi:MAG: pantetheine-phosphate adenylyltransferase [Clostridia bacterium]|nr:pantetheine-phosphate adenylyltransferase [Clostridia bacterium]
MKKTKKGLVAGSFDPITVGHLDVIERAAKLCDKLTVAVTVNLDKHCMFTMEQRLEMIRVATAHIENVEITILDGHLATFVMENDYDIHFRGLRNVSDFDYEIALAQLYAKYYNKQCETVYLMTTPENAYISSNIVRVNFSLGADVSGWVPTKVLKLMKKYSKINNK